MSARREGLAHDGFGAEQPMEEVQTAQPAVTIRVGRYVGNSAWAESPEALQAVVTVATNPELPTQYKTVLFPLLKRKEASNV